LGCSTTQKNKNLVVTEGEDYRIIIRDKDPALSEARAWDYAKKFCAKQNKRAFITRTDSHAIGAVTKEPPALAKILKEKEKTNFKTSSQSNELSQALVTVAERDHESVLYFKCI